MIFFTKIKDNITKEKMPITEYATLTTPPAPKKKTVSSNVRGVIRIIMEEWVDGKGLSGEEEREMINWIIQFYNISGHFPMLEDVSRQITVIKN